jgi:hypothetical protein
MKRLMDEEMTGDSASRVLVELVRAIAHLTESPLAKRRIVARLIALERERNLPGSLGAALERAFAAPLPCAFSPRRRLSCLLSERAVSAPGELLEITTTENGGGAGIVSGVGRFDRER